MIPAQEKDIVMLKKRKRRARLPAVQENLPAAEPRPPDQPVWTPEGVQWSRVPEAVRQAIREIIEPIYVESVLHASDGLEKSLAITLTHLLWLEILDQYEIKQDYANIEALLELPGNRESQINRHLRLLDSKIRFGKLLYKFRELRQRKSELPISSSPAPSLPAPPASESIPPFPAIEAIASTQSIPSNLS